LCLCALIQLSWSQDT